MNTLSEPWIALREALREPAEELTFRAVCAILDTWPNGDSAEAIAFAERSLTSWPDQTRVAPWSWLCAAIAGADKPSWRLVRSLRTDSGRGRSYDEVSLYGLGVRNWEHITRVETTGYVGRVGPEGRNDAIAAAAGAQRWPALRHLGRVHPRRESELHEFLSYPLLDQLESLELALPGYVGVPEPPTAPLAWPRFLPRLCRLCLAVYPDNNAASLLAPTQIPQLAHLELRNESYHFTTQEPFSH